MPSMPALSSPSQFLALKVLIPANSNTSYEAPSPIAALPPAPDCMFDHPCDGLLTPNCTLVHPPSPPLTKILASMESAEKRDVVPGTSPSCLARPSERARAVSTKSVEFLLTPKERVPLTLDTDFSPDPFHRAFSSPTPPVKEAFIENVGGFDITHLRKDSYGALPKISSHPSLAVSSDTPMHESTPPRLVPPPIDTAILPGEPRRRHTPVLRARLDLPRRFPPKVSSPTTTMPRQVLTRELVTGRQREPRQFPMKSESTTGLTQTYVFCGTLGVHGAGVKELESPESIGVGLARKAGREGSGNTGIGEEVERCGC